jgi:3-isopropylmalate/(R)-2-methylmalate dehydratase small subunit
MTGGSRIDRVSGTAIVLRGNDIDTDRIMPARFLKAVTFEGLDAHVFEDDRAEAVARGARHPFDDPARRGASILMVGANFGCGSSREHAPQGLRRRGVRAAVGESFGEIFLGNATAIGLPCVTVPPGDLQRLMAAAERDPAAVFLVDLQRSVVEGPGLSVAAALPASARDALVSGAWDAAGLLLDHYEDVERAARRIPYLNGF